jgi:hypothetical protein
MRYPVAVLALGAWFVCAAPVRAGGAPAEEKTAQSKIVSVGLFKNGLVVVKREVSVAGPGTYKLDKVPDAVHGTFWVESNAEIEAAMQLREIDVPAHKAGPLSLQDELAGRKVTLHLKGGKVAPVNGTVIRFERRDDEDAPAPRRFLVLKTARGRTYVDTGEVASVEVEGDNDTVKQRKAVLLLTVAKSDKRPKVHLSYLTTGLSWAPSYRIDITDPKSLAIEQGTVVRNEMADLKEAEVFLISGYPGVAFGHVLSPLSSKTNWANFFRQLSRRDGAFDPTLTNWTANTVVVQQAVRSTALPGLDLSAIPTGEGVDLHYQGIGKRALKKGNALALSLAKAKANYERIVEWTIPDNRDEYGRYVARGRNEDDNPWDALRFKNPFPFPMTTAPAMVVAGGKFNGQSTSYFVNPGEENVVRVTRALSIRTRAVETEEQNRKGNREIVYVGGREYRKGQVAGEVTVSNHRKETVKLVIRRRFSGELISADGNPRTVLREEGVWSVNRRNDLIWTVTLAPGEEKRLTYHYSVLVLN